MIQWLRLSAPNAGACIRSQVRELDPTCCNYHLTQTNIYIYIYIYIYKYTKILANL